MVTDRRAVGLALFMTAAGIVHFVAPGFYLGIMPRVIPRAWHRPLVYASGAAELAVAALTVVPATRAVGAIATEALLVGIFPANVQMALDSGNPSRTDLANNRLIAWGRLPLQLPMILWAHSVWRRHRRPPLGSP